MQSLRGHPGVIAIILALSAEVAATVVVGVVLVVPTRTSGADRIAAVGVVITGNRPPWAPRPTPTPAQKTIA